MQVYNFETNLKEDRYATRMHRFYRKSEVDAVIREAIAIAALEKDCEEDYWRFTLALSLLKTASSVYKGDRLAVVLYGY